MSIIYAISDIHGFYNEMKKSLNLVDLDSDKDNKLIFLGDYIDGGPKSCQVLYHIKMLEETYPDQVVCLIGNHDQMFIDWYQGKDLHQWLSHDLQMITTKSFFSENEFSRIFKEALLLKLSYEKIVTYFKKAFIKKHPQLLKWLSEKNNNLYYENNKQIFVHAGICETDETLWKYSTASEEFTWKFPAETGYFYKDIIAGHVSSAEVAMNHEFLGKVYWDKQSHYFIDGETKLSGNIPLLKYDTLSDTYSSFRFNNDRWKEYIINRGNNELI